MPLSNSVIICTYNRQEDLARCLHSLQQQTAPPTEIIIVDATPKELQSPVAMAPLLNQERYNGAQLFYLQTQKGLTIQRNIGIAQATGDIIYFFDDDVILEPDYLAQMQEQFQTKSHYVGGMGAVTNVPAPASNKYHLFRRLFFLQRDHADGRFTLSGMPTHAYGRTAFMNVEALGGCCMAFRRSALQKETFDEKLAHYAYMEDADMAWRVGKQGPLFYTPAARLAHMHSPISRDNIIKNRAMFMRNYRYLFFKNIYPQHPKRICAHWWSIIGLFLQAIILGHYDEIKGYMLGLKSDYHE